MLVPLALCPYVLYYALGGAIFSSSAMGGDKAGLSGPNDAWHSAAPWALIYGFPCQWRLAPLGSPTAITRQASFQAHLRPGRHTKNTPTIHCRNSGHYNVAACTYGWEVCRNQIDILREVYSVVQHSQLLHCSQVVIWLKWSATSVELTSCQAATRPLPSTHCLFYQSLWCGRGCEIWRESEEEIL